MAAGNGFITYRPDARYGDTTQTCGASDRAIAQKFTAPGSGTLDIDEIGLYAAYGTKSHNAKMAIYTDDSGNGCPEAIVSNSETSAFAINQNTQTLFTNSYATKPQVTAGVDYWLAICADSGTNETIYDNIATGGTSVMYVQNYPVFPSASEWHSHTDLTKDFGFYAKYSVPAASTIPVFAYNYNNMRT